MDEERLPQKIKLDTYWKKKKRETENKMEITHTYSHESWKNVVCEMGSVRPDFVRDWVSKDVAYVTERLHTYIHTYILSIRRSRVGYFYLTTTVETAPETSSFHFRIQWWMKTR
jgi:hypothetical protein